MKEVRFKPPTGSGLAEEEDLLFRRMYCREQLGRLSEFRLELLRASSKKAVTAKDMLGKAACVEMLTDVNGKKRHLHGLVTEFERGGEVRGRYDLYRVVMRPWLWKLTLGEDCRIFQNKSVVEILDAIFDEYGSTSQVKKRLSGQYKARAYTVQYRESDFHFVSRLMEATGIYYYFEHEESQHKLVLCDSPSGHDPKGTVAWSSKQETGERVRDDILTEWTLIHTLQPLKFATTDYAAEKPTTDLLAEAKRKDPYTESSDLEVFDYPGLHDDLQMAEGQSAVPTGQKAADGRQRADVEVARFESRHSVAKALTLLRPLAVGSTFKFKDHPDAGDYLMTSSITTMEYSGYEAETDDASTSYHCRFDAVPKTTTFQPDRSCRPPVVNGPQTATVVGPAGNEIHTDRHGRVKVLFHWDRVGRKAKDGKSSCFVRVSQPWAGKGFGFMALPRIGDEVVVEFLEGNPDRPLITGRVYNGDNPPPWKLPDLATVSGVKTRSSKGGGEGTFNELRFDDKKGSEHVWFQAEKDYHQWVKNDAQVTIKGMRKQLVEKDDQFKISGKLDGDIAKTVTLKIGTDTHGSIGGDLMIKVGGAAGLTIAGATKVKSDGAMSLTTAAALDVTAASGVKLNSDAAFHIKATAGVMIDGGMSLTIKAGAGFIVLDGSGVSIVGPMVKINSGGSASPAQKAAAATVPAPKDPPELPEHKDPLAGT